MGSMQRLTRELALVLQVKQAYKELSKQRHPDRVVPARRIAAEAEFIALGEAYTAALRRTLFMATAQCGSA